MNFKSYSRLNNIVGWAVFAIAAFTYLSTMEWTVSLWDCGEFIPSAFKLEVSHPPGAPLHGIINHLFTMLSFGNTKMVPILVNSSAALASAFTILFLFWTITALALKLLVKNNEGEIESGTIWAILGAGAVGGLAYTFSDTIWFSAVEGEVYALSSFFTALIFWVALKWERRADEARHLRWFVLMFYLVGLVIGIHLLGLLVIPVIVLMYYYKKYKVTRWGVLAALLVGFGALGIVQVVIIQWLLTIAAHFDLWFVNDMHLPFWSGVIFFFVALLAAACYGIYYTHKHKKVIWNLALTSFVAVVVGYFSYTMTVVRSYANPPIDMNDPEDVFNLMDYLSRAQYGDSYVLSGPYFNGDRYADLENGSMQYYKDEKNQKYQEDGYRKHQKFPDEFITFFPRLYSSQDNHKQGYRAWLNLKRVVDPESGKEVWEDEVPSFRFSFMKHNMRFFFNYQIKYMYWRYFAWNFIGRQNDMQGTHGEFHQGNWITGIPFIDKALDTGPQDNIPAYMRNNRAHNALYGLPFILGLLGMYFQFKRKKLDFALVFLFFFMTGLAIEIYLNMPDPQPRERDYAFVGSFYVFAIWIGLGVLFIWDKLRNRMPSVSAASAATLLCLVAVPVLMASKEWDDHDRSNRYTSLDYGTDYLYSCMPHSILLCNGDNDTYPLWYAQEVEGIRDDIRIVNLSLLSTDWYINELRKPINHAPGLPFSITPEKLKGWEYAYYNKDFVQQFDQTVPVDVHEVMKYITSHESRNPNIGSGQVPLMPTRKLKVKVDKEKVLKNGMVAPQYAEMVPEYIEFDLNKTTYMKSDLMVMDMIATANWDVPIYFSITSGASEYQNLGKYLQQEGLAYRLVPYTVKGYEGGGRNIRVELDTMYKNMMTKFKWGGLDKGNHLVDYVTSRTCYTMRGMFYTLCDNLLNAGRKEDAIKAADKCMEVLPERNVPFDASVGNLVQIYNEAGAVDKAKKLSDHLTDLLIEELNYYSRVRPEQWQDVGDELNNGMRMLQMLGQEADKHDQKDLSAKIKNALEGFNRIFAAAQ